VPGLTSTERTELAVTKRRIAELRECPLSVFLDGGPWEPVEERAHNPQILNKPSCGFLIDRVFSRTDDQALADNDVRPLCVHRLRYQPAQTSTVEHRRQWRNGRTSTERY
jgi:hypothetical protein